VNEPHPPQSSPRAAAVDAAPRRIAAWFVERLHSANPPDLAAVEPLPLFAIEPRDER